MKYSLSKVSTEIIENLLLWDRSRITPASFWILPLRQQLSALSDLFPAYLRQHLPHPREKPWLQDRKSRGRGGLGKPKNLFSADNKVAWNVVSSKTLSLWKFTVRVIFETYLWRQAPRFLARITKGVIASERVFKVSKRVTQGRYYLKRVTQGRYYLKRVTQGRYYLKVKPANIQKLLFLKNNLRILNYYL